MNPAERAALRQCVERVVIVAYQENTDQLRSVMSEEGFADVSVLRATYTKEEEAYSRNFRCLMSHRNAWAEAAARPGWTLVMEADFVPCKGIGSFRMPVPASGKPGLDWAYLYNSASRIFWQLPGGLLRGHQASTVCYLIHGAVAAKLLAFWEQQVRNYGMGSYFAFDAHLQWALMGQGCEAYFPQRSYGEHGGMPNPEHRKEGIASNDGRHRADVLAGPLSFLPPYAAGSMGRYRIARLGARLKSIARLLTGRWFAVVNVRSVPRAERVRLLWLGLKRHLVF